MTSTVKSEKADNPKYRRRQPRLSDNPTGQRILAALGDRPVRWLNVKTGISEQTLSDAIRVGVRKVGDAVAIAGALEKSVDWLLTGGGDSDEHFSGADQVGIDEIDMAYGLGGTYTDSPTKTTVRLFDRAWLRTITTAAPADLTWTRGSGDSMETTIRDGDLILIDRSQNAIREDDAIWAFTIGEIGSIKRLRIRSDKVTILSDNQLVPPDAATHDEINIVGRVVFIGRKI